MQLINSAKGYGAVPQALHWLTALLVAITWALGVLGEDLPSGGARASALFIHIAAGIAILAMLAVRLTWRLVDPAPPTEETEFATWMGKWQDPAARFAHYLLYALLFAVPVAGIVLQFARGDALPVFGMTEIASPWPRDRAFAHNVKEVHEILAHALVVVAAMHAAAALIHHWIFRDRTLLRMLPHFWKPSSTPGAGE
ncbi:cytochrome b [Bradyrhizobium sp. BTAi1]|uniref:cytochrome b n=1 Tax=Bradyrhizobium sp. (strain BTAi1 / ATCC BAA-1182) TaxID=288000 RepID=UPI00005DEB25|nr:cytochrome b [Bradyrhizobium sp. BTAi1]ABQ35514.1 putative Cytochrome b561 family [Bradyrhizobium sp. BTAi1]